MLRVTESMIFSQVTTSVAAAQRRAYQAQSVAQSGMRVSRSSDDPLSASRANILSATLQRLEGMEGVSARATEELTVAESALGEATALMTRAREIAMAGATDSMGAESRAALALEAEGLRDQMLTLANTRVGDVFVFGGFQTSEPPYDQNGTYSGDSGARRGEIVPGTSVTMNIPGEVAFQDTTDLFAVLEQLVTDLQANDGGAVGESLTDLENGFLQINSARARTGVYLSQIQTGDQLRYQLESSALVHRTESVEADINESFNALAQTQFALQAAVAQAQTILSGLQSGFR